MARPLNALAHTLFTLVFTVSTPLAAGFLSTDGRLALSVSVEHAAPHRLLPHHSAAPHRLRPRRTAGISMDLKDASVQMRNEFASTGAAVLPETAIRRNAEGSVHRNSVRDVTTDRVRIIDSAAALEAAMRSTDGIKVVMFGARWCSACRAMLPRIKRLAAGRPSVQFYSISHSKALAPLFDQHGIVEVPTLMVVDRAGRRLHSRACASPTELRAFEATLDSLLDEHGQLVWAP